MSYDPHTDKTTQQRLPRPFNGTIFTTTRQVSAEKPVPELGITMEKELGAGWESSRVISVVKGPERAPSDQLVIQHAIIPSEADQLDSNWEKGEYPVGGKTYDAVFRTVILLASGYNEAGPAINSAMPIGAGNRFSGQGYTFYDEECISSGTALEPVFRVVRRIYIKKANQQGDSTGTWGVELNKERVVVAGAQTPYGFGIKSAAVDPIGNGHAVEVRVDYPTPIEDNVIYTLTAQEHDDTTGAIIDTSKTLVNAAAAVALATTRRTAGFYTEIQPLDKWHSILIGAKINTMPKDETWNETGRIELPDVLEQIGVIWDANTDKDAGTAGVDNIATIIAREYNWTVSAEAAIVGSVSGRPFVKIKDGFRGNANVSVSRTYHEGPPAGSITPFNFNTVQGTLAIHGVSKNINAQSSKNGIGDISISGKARLKYSYDDSLMIQHVGPVVHGGSLVITELGDSPTITDSVVASGGSVPGGGLYPVATANLNITAKASIQIPDSSAPLSSGGSFILHVDVRPWRLGVWVKDVYTAYVP